MANTTTAPKKSAVLAPIGDPPSIQLVAPARLKIDETYQRTISGKDSQAAIARYAHAWDWRLCVPLLVSQRDDGLYVIDGQHRLEAARRRGDITYLPCCVSEYGSPADEAATFVAANRKRRAVSRVDTFRAALLAGDPVATSINGLLRKNELTVARSAAVIALQPGEVSCIGVLEKMLATHGPDRLGAALSAISTAFRGETLRYGAPLIQAVCGILANGRTASHWRAVQDTLARRTAEEWREAALARPGTTSGGQSMTWGLRAVITECLADPGAAAVIASPSAAPPILATGSAKPRRTFEEQMEAVRNGAQLVEVAPLRRPDPEHTLGGVGSSML